MSELNKKIFKVLICPDCGVDITKRVDNCPTCGRQIIFIDNKIYLNKFDSTEVRNLLYKVKYLLKFRTKIYDKLIIIFGPVLYFPLELSLRRFFKKYKTSEDQIVVNIGSGNTLLTDGIINLDLVEYKNVNIVSDINRLPFHDNSIDILVNIAVLEHVPNPEGVVKDIFRVMKPGGIVYSYIPFLQPFHASPYDYKRFTYEGIKNLYSQFEVISTKPTGGPTSALVWILQEWVTLILSFGIKPLHFFIYTIVMLLTFPLKILDLLFTIHPLANNIASGFSIIVRRR
jgi:SAM-dependent methyltransferase